LHTHCFRTGQHFEWKFGDSTKFDISPYRGNAEFIFIHGGHDAQLVANDTLKVIEIQFSEKIMLR
jgi:hypothetical protein